MDCRPCSIPKKKKIPRPYKPKYSLVLFYMDIFSFDCFVLQHILVSHKRSNNSVIDKEQEALLVGLTTLLEPKFFWYPLSFFGVFDRSQTDWSQTVVQSPAAMKPGTLFWSHTVVFAFWAESYWNIQCSPSQLLICFTTPSKHPAGTLLTLHQFYLLNHYNNWMLTTLNLWNNIFRIWLSFALFKTSSTEKCFHP